MDQTKDQARELGRLQQRCQELEAQNQLMRQLLQLDDYEKMLDVLVEHCFGLLGAERGFLVLSRGEALDFRIVRNWSLEELEARDRLSRSILKEVLRQRQPVLIEDALADPRFGDRGSVSLHQVRSVMAAPLQVEGESAGVLYLECRTPRKFFTPNHFERFKELLQAGSRALDVCVKRLLLEQRSSMLEKELLTRYDFQGILTQDPGFLKILEVVGQSAATDLPVLIQGPSGSGKELVARALHFNGARARRPLVTVNCGALSPQLLESELFGHVKGAFTGAVSDKQGLLREAHRGTLFLDEIGELPRELQVKLLRTLQFGEIQRVGSSKVEIVDVRFIAATNRKLEEEIEEGNFREDLFFRLNTVMIHLPALRQRPDDILPLFHNFLGQALSKLGRPLPGLEPGLEAALLAYDWPGNVRELENEARRLAAVTPPGVKLSADRLSRRVVEVRAEKQRPGQLVTLEEMEKVAVEQHLFEAKGNRSQAARTLGISRETLRLKMKRYGLE